jgi:hypothetical protein
VDSRVGLNVVVLEKYLPLLGIEPLRSSSKAVSFEANIVTLFPSSKRQELVKKRRVQKNTECEVFNAMLFIQFQ